MTWNPRFLRYWRRLITGFCVAGAAALLLSGCNGYIDLCEGVEDGACATGVYWL
jgi:hypothetical protein